MERKINLFFLLHEFRKFQKIFYFFMNWEKFSFQFFKWVLRWKFCFSLKYISWVYLIIFLPKNLPVWIESIKNVIWEGWWNLVILLGSFSWCWNFCGEVQKINCVLKLISQYLSLRLFFWRGGYFWWDTFFVKILDLTVKAFIFMSLECLEHFVNIFMSTYILAIQPMILKTILLSRNRIDVLINDRAEFDDSLSFNQRGPTLALAKTSFHDSNSTLPEHHIVKMTATTF